MDHKKVIALSHRIREQLAEVVLHLPDFTLDDASRDLIFTNRTSWQPGASQPSVISRVLAAIIQSVRQVVGLVNFKRYTSSAGDVVFANGGFLLTHKPYVVYVEKSTQLFGYSGKQYGKPLAKWMLRFFLRQPNLKWLFFRTEAARTGMMNIPEFTSEIKKLIEQKGIVVYPPLENPGKSDLARFKNPDVITFLTITSLFYEKGSLELIHAFDRLSQQVSNVQLIIITKQDQIKPEHQALIAANKKIVVHEATFSRQELFDQFLNKAHVFVYPTYSDSFSAVINEAIAADLPIITSDFYAIPERVKEGKNGMLFASPWPNYDKNMVIHEEHFKPDSAFPRELPEWQAAGKLQYVEDFLYDAMHKLATDASLHQSMAQASRAIYETQLSPGAIREKINQRFLDALTDKNGE